MLDSLLIDLKLQPSALEIPVPRYFLEDDRENLETRKQLLDKILLGEFHTDEPEEDEEEDP